VADLISHLLVNRLLGQRALEATTLSWFVSGAVAPDLASRVPRVGLNLLLSQGMLEPSPGLRALSFGLDLPHLPAGLLLLCVAVAAIVPRRWLPRSGRARAGFWLFAGGMSHLAVDLMQEHIVPAYAYLWPLVATRFELGWVSTEASLAAIPFLAAAVWWTHPEQGRAAPSHKDRPTDSNAG
jgi:hypothetical protein